MHTNLGRSCLAPTAIDNLVRIAGSYSNLEFDLEAGKRGSRYRAVEALLCELSGAEAADRSFGQPGANFLEKSHFVANLQGLLMRDSKGKCFRQR